MEEKERVQTALLLIVSPPKGGGSENPKEAGKKERIEKDRYHNFNEVLFELVAFRIVIFIDITVRYIYILSLSS